MKRMSEYAHFKGRATIPHNVRSLGPDTRVLTKLGRSKYMPHVGAKEVARHAGRTSLGANASRALHDGLTNRDVEILREINDQDHAALDAEMRLQMNERISRPSAV